MNNFLSIVWYRVLPPEYGGQKGIAHFNDCLGKKMPLTCLCSRNNTPEDSLSYKVLNSLPVSRFQFWNLFVRKHILSLISRQSFSHIIIEHPWHGWLGKYKQKCGFRFIVHAHNIEHLRMKANGKPWWWLVKRTEQKAFALADQILFKTQRDKATALQLFNISPQKCLIVPYGISEAEPPPPNMQIKEQLRKKYKLDPEEKLILFAGTLTYEPNIKAVEAIAGHIIPLLQKKSFRFKLIICGALPEKRITQLNAIANVIATGFVASIADYMQSADVFINPVTNGSGIQTKNIEAIANGCNVVATAFAATGLPDYLSGKKVFVSADNEWTHFADNIIMASSLPAAVPQRFYNDYNWQNIIDRFLQEAATEE